MSRSRFFCLRRGRHSLSFWVFAGLASAFSYRLASVAPVRGGTYFLCRRKESKQRKRAHTASPCWCPRALNVPAFHTATFRLFFVAGASNRRLIHFNHFFNGERQRVACAPCGKLCVGCHAVKRSVPAKKHSVPRRMWCDNRHTVCRKAAAMVC